jgi:hypothetical protein
MRHVRARRGGLFVVSKRPVASLHSDFAAARRGISFYGTRPLLEVSPQNRAENIDYDSLYTRARVKYAELGKPIWCTPLPMSYEKYSEIRMANGICARPMIEESNQRFKASSGSKFGRRNRDRRAVPNQVEDVPKDFRRRQHRTCACKGIDHD